MRDSAIREMKGVPTRGRTWVHAYNHYDSYMQKGVERVGIGEPTPMKARITSFGEHVLSTERFSLNISAQVETCSDFWARVLIFDTGTLAETRRVLVEQGDWQTAIQRAREIAQTYFDKQTAEHQLALAV